LHYLAGKRRKSPQPKTRKSERKKAKVGSNCQKGKRTGSRWKGNLFHTRIIVKAKKSYSKREWNEGLAPSVEHFRWREAKRGGRGEGGG